jgi:predicted transcriptional regulator
VENTTEITNAVELTAGIVSAYVSKNAVMSGDLPGLIMEIIGDAPVTQLPSDRRSR